MTLLLEVTLPLCKFTSGRLQFNEFTVDELQEVRNVKSVKIYNGSYPPETLCNYNDILFHVSLNCQRVEKIEIEDYSGQLSRTFFSVLYQYYPKLKVLELICCGAEIRNSYSLLSALDNLKTLAIYPLIAISDFDSRDLKSIASGKASLQKLLIPFAVDVSDESLVQFLVAKRDSLEELSIAGNKISDIGYQALSQCTCLRELHVSDASGVGAAGLHALSQLPCFRKLTLRAAKFPCQVLSKWLQTSPVLRNLRWLDLKYYRGWQPQLDRIMAMLVKENKNLVFVR